MKSIEQLLISIQHIKDSIEYIEYHLEDVIDENGYPIVECKWCENKFSKHHNTQKYCQECSLNREKILSAMRRKKR